MSSSPVKPIDFKNAVSNASSALCGNFVSTLLKLPVLIYQFFSYALDVSGNVTNEFRRQIVKSGDLIFSATGLAEDSGRLLCNGQLVSRTTYADLFTAIGENYGVGDGTTTFQLPDYRARFPICVGSLPSLALVAIGNTGGEETHKLTNAEAGVNNDHVHVFGRMKTTDHGRLVTGAKTKPDLNGEDFNQDGGSGPLSDYTGSYLNTGPAEDPIEDADVDVHNNMPPYVGVYIYVAT